MAKGKSGSSGVQRRGVMTRGAGLLLLAIAFVASSAWGRPATIAAKRPKPSVEQKEPSQVEVERPAGTRLALVIGNGRYKNALVLDNPPNDAALMAKTLTGVGFTVTEIEDVETQSMRQAIAKFGRSAVGADIALIYYAGHGIQVGGVNYLIPVDAQLSDELALDVETIDARSLLAAITGAKTKIMVLDACRANPFASRMKVLNKTRAVTRGLGRIDPNAGGTMIAFSTSPDELALDGSGGNSPYAKALARFLPTPNLDIQQVFNRVRAEVSRETEARQLPWENGSLFGDVYIGGKTVVPEGGVADPETLAWNNSGCRPGATSGCASYAQRYPQGRYRDIADYLLESAASPTLPPIEVASIGSDGTRAFVPAKGRGSLDSLSAGTTFRDCPKCPEMVVVAPGRFQMGSPSGETDRFDNEGPQHPVSLVRAIGVQTMPVTRADWQAYVTAVGDRMAGQGCNVFDTRDQSWNFRKNRSWREPDFPQTDRDPVVCVSWNEAQNYMAWLAAQSGRRYRLLSEAEYEYLNRAGSSDPFPWAGGAEAICKHANVADATLKAKASSLDTASCSDGFAYTSPVNQFPANAFGLFDMTGNVWSMTGDCWNDSFDGAPADGSAWSGGDCNQHVVRGGSWNYTPDKVRAAARASVDSDAGSNILGFRIARAD